MHHGMGKRKTKEGVGGAEGEGGRKVRVGTGGRCVWGGEEGVGGKEGVGGEEKKVQVGREGRCGWGGGDVSVLGVGVLSILLWKSTKARGAQLIEWQFHRFGPVQYMEVYCVRLCVCVRVCCVCVYLCVCVCVCVCVFVQELLCADL